jgi:hypothetical protein
MHFIKYRLALAFVCAFIIGSAINIWYVWVMAALNEESTVTFTTNSFHEQLPEFVFLVFFFMVLAWLIFKRGELKRWYRMLDKAELRKGDWL